MKDCGTVVWITGLSGAGKTTTSQLLVEKLKLDGRKVISLDGDQLGKVFKRKDYSKESRIILGLQYSDLCKLLSSQGFIVVISCIGLIKEIEEYNRLNIFRYIDVFLDTPIKVLEERDTKGLYSRFRKGLIKNVYGMDIDYDKPESPCLDIKFSETQSAKQVANKIYDYLRKLDC